MNVCDVPIHELRIGQVVQFPAHYAVIVQITMEVGGHWLDWDSLKRSEYNRQRYSSITYLMETGRVVSPGFHMNDEYPIVDRVITEAEIFKFKEVVEKENSGWGLR